MPVVVQTPGLHEQVLARIGPDLVAGVLVESQVLRLQPLDAQYLTLNQHPADQVGADPGKYLLVQAGGLDDHGHQFAHEPILQQTVVEQKITSILLQPLISYDHMLHRGTWLVPTGSANLTAEE